MEQSIGGSSWVEKGKLYSVGSKKWHRWSPPGDGSKLRRENMTWISDLETVFTEVLTKVNGLNIWLKGKIVEKQK